MGYAVRQTTGHKLGERETLNDAERMALYLTSGYGPLEIVDSQGVVVETVWSEPAATTTETPRTAEKRPEGFRRSA